MTTRTPREELHDAFAAAALLTRLTVIHHTPRGYRDGDASFACDWCGRTVLMTEMRSHGGTSGWCDAKEKVLEGPGFVGCWEMFPPESV